MSVASKNKSENEDGLEIIKENKLKLKLSSAIPINQQNVENTQLSIPPVVGTDFIGIDNAGNNSPLDNTIAISNNGKIVTCVNSIVAYYDENSSFINSFTLTNFINDINVSTNVCDPKVIYDSGADKFILFAQTCDGVAASSQIIIAFSLSNDPNAGFYVYKLSGNPLNNNCWFDYPKIAVTNNELIVTGNLFVQGGSFNQAVIYQIEKANGFTGGNINFQYWTGINAAPFTLLPVGYGQQGNYGPGMYLVATDPVTTGSTNIKLYNLTNEMSASNEQLMLYNVPTTNYSVPAKAQQQGSSILLNNGDCRTQAGFYLNGIIHFVFHSDIGSGWTGVNYNRLTVATTTNISSTFGNVGVADFCFPAVASIGNTTSDKSVVISFSSSSSNIFPQVRAVTCDNFLNWSNSTLIKDGESFIDYSFITGDERWGDYSGLARKYNTNPPMVWLAGDYAAANNNWRQWIAEISVPGLSAIKQNVLSEKKVSVFPNPVLDSYKVLFSTETREDIVICINDFTGKKVKELYVGQSFVGKNAYMFNKAQLQSGLYYLVISNKNKILVNEKIIVAD